MIFTATRFENNAMIRCEADNVVMRNEMDKPLHDSLALEVMCKEQFSYLKLTRKNFFFHCTVWMRKLNWKFNEITRKMLFSFTRRLCIVGRNEKATRNERNQFSVFHCFLSLYSRLYMSKLIPDPPVVVVKPDNITINETGEFLLFCEYDANPASLASVRWLQNSTVLNLNQSRFDGGNPEQTALLVKNATREDRGAYSCELSNQVGTGMSENGVVVDVQCEFSFFLLSIIRIKPLRCKGAMSSKCFFPNCFVKKRLHVLLFSLSKQINQPYRYASSHHRQ